MNRRYRRYNNTSKFKEIFLSHIENNIKEYIIVSIIFIIGIIIGVIFINKTSIIQREEITGYISSFTTELKSDKSVDEVKLLIDSIKKNILLAIFLWFMGSTVIGISVVYLTICFRGFCLGYTISSIILTFGIGKGILFLLSSVFLQNILFIPCILALAVSGMKLHNSIMEDKARENIKVEILRHTIFSLFILIVLMVSSLIETYISKNILLGIIKYI